MARFAHAAARFAACVLRCWRRARGRPARGVAGSQSKPPPLLPDYRLIRPLVCVDNMRAASLRVLVFALLACSHPRVAGARRKPKQRQRPPPQQQQGALITPLDVDGAAGTSGGAAAVRHLFATPLYVANLSDSVDGAALASLALGGYSIVANSPSVQKAIVGLRVAMESAPSPAVIAQLNDDAIFTHNDKFFYYQMGNAAKCERAAAPECAEVRWDAVFASSALQQLELAIAEAVPRYFATAGVSESEIPSYTIKMWASVMAPGAKHTEHEHSSAGAFSPHCVPLLLELGSCLCHRAQAACQPAFPVRTCQLIHTYAVPCETGECLLSGVFYAAAPPGSGAIRFSDHRRHLAAHPLAFPTESYDHTPEAQCVAHVLATVTCSPCFWAGC
eukprot:COSAG05_NODE_3782_length_1839_cov_26.770115_2_plen_390_part_00